MGPDDRTNPVCPIPALVPDLVSPTMALVPNTTDAIVAMVSMLPLNKDTTAVDHYDITKWDLAQVYFSQDCFGHAFQESFDYMRSPMVIHLTA